MYNLKRMFGSIQGQAIQENRPLFREELQEVVPSIFATTAHESRSDRFAPVSTIQVLDALKEHGWSPFFAVQSNVRDESKKEFTKHMVRLRKEGDIMSPMGTVREVILTNANDGTSAFNLHSGFFRFVCSNGLFAGRMTHQNKVYHKGVNIMDDVIEGVYTVVNEFEEAEQYQNEMHKIVLDDEQRHKLAMKAFLIREGVPENLDFSNLKYDPRQLLIGHNPEDRTSKTLLSTFNVLQENSIRGGAGGSNANGRATRTRQIKNINEGIRVNTALWEMAKEAVHVA